MDLLMITAGALCILELMTTTEQTRSCNCFLSAVTRLGLPKRICGDRGESVDIAR